MEGYLLFTTEQIPIIHLADTEDIYAYNSDLAKRPTRRLTVLIFTAN